MALPAEPCQYHKLEIQNKIPGVPSNMFLLYHLHLQCIFHRQREKNNLKNIQGAVVGEKFVSTMHISI